MDPLARRVVAGPPNNRRLTCPCPPAARRSSPRRPSRPRPCRSTDTAGAAWPSSSERAGAHGRPGHRPVARPRCHDAHREVRRQPADQRVHRRPAAGDDPGGHPPRGDGHRPAGDGPRAWWRCLGNALVPDLTINGTSVKARYGVSYLYVASGLVRVYVAPITLTAKCAANLRASASTTARLRVTSRRAPASWRRPP